LSLAGGGTCGGGTGVVVCGDGKKSRVCVVSYDLNLGFRVCF